jgi:large subunit ribosomal protein LP1
MSVLIEVEPFWPSLFAKALEGQNVGALIANIGSGAGAAPAAGAAAPAAAAAAPAAAAAAPAAKAAPKKKTTSDDDMGFGTLLDWLKASAATGPVS